MKKPILALLLAFALPVFARAATCPTYPFTLTNGLVADANQVMANFNSILNCANSSLQPTITFPISIANGGSGQTTASAALTAFGGLAISNNLSDLGSAATARTNLGLGTAALAATGTSGHTLPFLDGANTWSGDQAITGSHLLSMDGAVSTNRILRWTTSGTARWAFYTDGTPETGSNTGSNLNIQAQADGGGALSVVVNINRASGLVTINNGLTVAGAFTATGGLAVSGGSATVGGQAVVTTNDSRFGGPTQNAQVSSYTLVASDAGAQIFMNCGSTATLTIPTNGSVAFPVGTKIEIAGSGSCTTTVSTADTLWWSPTGTTGSRTLSTFGLATLTKITATGWFITGAGVS
jgi:hypothetical protein